VSNAKPTTTTPNMPSVFGLISLECTGRPRVAE
jgi:hypothetical protein